MTDKAAVKQKFIDAFDPLVEDLLAVLKQYNISPEATEWFKKSLYYNGVGGKLNRGLSVIDTYKILTGKDDLTDEEYKKAAVLGWAIELLQAFFLVSDDIMDSSKTRRGQPCWYLVPKVGMIAINDAFMLETSIYVLLKKYFRSEPYYIDLIELFHDVTFQTELGQLLDLITAPEDEVDLSKFSLEKHSFIVIYKTAYYSFYLPVALAMYMAGIGSPEDLKQAHDVLIPLGEYFQIQDDYLDCYGDPAFIGKIGTDIFDNKCSWLINTALKKADQEQRKILDENYGQKDSACEAKVKAIYRDLDLENDYFKYEEDVVGRIRALIDNVDESRGFQKDVLSAFLAKIYKRQK
ncbi:isoprenoid synthase domain-containing protein [Lipomyces tetrasporus]|uniref:Farnesyl pyrophosphate synthase n=1 Tax=Lipomyces tetrasporus TaxID=54092 RepID=A0AAD7QSG4_9ASCO|nr:isoprenoid synthase domain-containing protein [Lipomyces tetrasporus]KAJ8100595.1 isoprenoid synthase domain-containing protein [Lipomyces tetrasporus]